MNPHPEKQYVVFVGPKRIASGGLNEAVKAAKAAVDSKVPSSVLVFDTGTSEQLEVDFRGSLEEVLSRLPSPADEPDVGAIEAGAAGSRLPGRPKLGVVPREVTLLPRHWDWLATQPGGASVTLRKLVEQARRSSGDADRIRLAREVTYRFMSAMAGDEAGFEEAARALFAGNQERLETAMDSWPGDVREHTRQLSKDAFQISAG